MTMFSALKVELEFTPGTWTDFTSSVAGDVEINQGRPTPYDQIAPGNATIPLRTADGSLIPENTSSPYYPNVRTGIRARVSMVKAGTTYLRFTGYVTAFTLSFQTEGTESAVTTLTVYDALSLIQGRTLNDYWTEKTLAETRAVSGWYEGYRLTSPLATAPSYAADTLLSGLSSPGGSLAMSLPLSAGAPAPATDDPTKYGTTGEGAFTISNNASGSSGPTAWNNMKMQPRANAQTHGLLISMTSDYFGSTAFAEYICAIYDSGGSIIVSVAYHYDGTTLGAFLYNTFIGGTILASTSLGASSGINNAIMEFRMNAGTNTSMDWVVNGSVIYTKTSCDVRSFSHVDIGGVRYVRFNNCYSLSYRSATNSVTDTHQAGQGISTIMTRWQGAMSDTGISFATAGSDTTMQVTPGYWLSKSALDIGRTLMRSAGGVLWARPDGTVVQMMPDAMRPLAALLTLSVEADTVGTPTVLLADDTRPTRVAASTLSTTVTAIDSDAESTVPVGRRRDLPLTVLNANSADAKTIAWAPMLHPTRFRFQRVSLDLLAPGNDYTSTIFSTSGTLGALYPTQRIGLTIPSGLFGATTKGAFIYGWKETYSQTTATLDLDCEGATVATVTGGTCVGNTGTGTIVVTTDSVWVTNADAYPLDMDWAGERITVNAPGGSTNPQTFTVTARGVAGGAAASSHSTGTSIDSWISGV